jgi:hypothetical protein
MTADGKKLGKFTIITIVGMHRSGTSLLAETINRMGVSLGTHLLEANEFNKRGYFEDLKVIEIHDELLAELNRPWGTIGHTFPLPKGWETSKAAVNAQSKLYAYLKREIAKKNPNALWGVKDPRLSLFLPIWKTVAKKLCVELKIIFCLRGVEEVAKSLQRRDGLPADASRLIWMNYNSSIIQHSHDIPISLFFFDDWQNKPQKTMKRLAEFCGVPDAGMTDIIFDKTLPSSPRKNTTGLAARWEKAISDARKTNDVTENMQILAAEHELFLDNTQIWAQFIDDEVIRDSIYERLGKDAGIYREKIAETTKIARKNLEAYKKVSTELDAERTQSKELQAAIAKQEQTIKSVKQVADENLAAYRKVDKLLGAEKADNKRLNAELQKAVVASQDNLEAYKKVSTELDAERTQSKELQAAIAKQEQTIKSVRQVADENLEAFKKASVELDAARNQSKELQAEIAKQEQVIKSVTQVADENLAAYRKVDTLLEEERAKVVELQLELEEHKNRFLWFWKKSK